MTALPPFIGWFDDPVVGQHLPVELILIERPVAGMYGPWKVAGALVKEPGKAPAWLAGWVYDDYAATDEPSLWDYLIEEDGNGYTTNVGFVRTASVADAEAVVRHLDEQFKSGHPLGMTGPSVSAEPVSARAAPEPPLRAEPNTDGNGPGLQLPFGVADLMTWRLAAELVRRHPQHLWAVRTYPMDGHYDCLTVRTVSAPTSGPSISLNRLGNHSSVDRFDYVSGDGALVSWSRAYWLQDPRQWLLAVERAARLPSPSGKLPESTPSSISVRFVAAFMAAQFGARHRWEAQTLWSPPALAADAALGIGAAIRQWMKPRLDEGAGRVWTLSRQGRAELAVTVDGVLLRDGREPVELLPTYRKQKSTITGLLSATVADLLK